MNDEGIWRSLVGDENYEKIEKEYQRKVFEDKIRHNAELRMIKDMERRCRLIHEQKKRSLFSKLFPFLRSSWSLRSYDEE